MKFNKMMFAAIAFGALTLVACEKKPDVIVPPTPGTDTTTVEPEVEIPEVDAPADGYVTLVIEIPANSECNGIAFKGTRNGTWADCSGENTYVGENAENVGPDACIKFEKIEGNWYKATYKLADEAWGDAGVRLAGKICLIYTNDGSWEGQAKEMSLNDEYTTADCNYQGDNLEIMGSGLVYAHIAKWNKSECAEVVLKQRHVVLVVPTNDCGFEVPSIVGSFNSWNATEIAMTPVAGEEGKYEATVTADAADEFKFAGSVSGWDNEIRAYDKESDELKDNNPNIAFGEETEFLIDYSDGKWKACAE